MVPPLSGPQSGFVVWLCRLVVWVWLCGVIAWCGLCGVVLPKYHQIQRRYPRFGTKIPPLTKEVLKFLEPKDHHVQRRYQSFTIRYPAGTKLVPSDTQQVPSWYHQIPSRYQVGTTRYPAGTKLVPSDTQQVQTQQIPIYSTGREGVGKIF